MNQLKIGDKITYFGESNLQFSKNKKYVVTNIETYKGDYLIFKYFQIINDKKIISWHISNDPDFNDIRKERKRKLQKINESVKNRR